MMGIPVKAIGLYISQCVNLCRNEENLKHVNIVIFSSENMSWMGPSGTSLGFPAV